MQVDLTNLVQYPPKIQPVPVKPLFLDVAWNYIDYPGRQTETVVGKVAEAVETVINGDHEERQPEQKKRGWFGFGR